MRRRKVKVSLKVKITALIFGLVILTMAAVFTYTINMNITMMQNEIGRNARKVAESLSALRLVTSWKSDEVNWAVYDKYMEILARLDRNIVMMAVVDEKKAVKAHAINYDMLKKDFKELEVPGDKKGFIDVLSDTNLKDTLKVTMPIQIQGASFAGVVIKFSKKSYINRMNIMILNMIILTIVLLGAGFAGAWTLARLITSNFGIIAAGMRKVAEGDLHVEVNVKTNDEVGVLADDFNRMIIELREKVRIKDAFETVADGLKDMDGLKNAYKVLTYQEMTDKITRGYAPPPSADAVNAVFVFIDTSSFMSFTFELLSEEMKGLIEKFIEKIALTALEYRGAVLKVTGDYVLLSFGYPFKHEDDLKRAFISTVEIRKEIVSMVKGKLAMGYEIDDFRINFIMLNGSISKSFTDKESGEKYKAALDYLNFAAKYGEKKKYTTDVYSSREIAAGIDNLAVFEPVDTVTMPDGSGFELLKLKATKF
ncbi:MAG TPA: HAMP domain-containing protein [bacterium]|nr:HAMP domain-containing protein [bacterium]